MTTALAPSFLLALCAVAFLGTLVSAASEGLLKGALRQAGGPFLDTADPLLAIRGLHAAMMFSWIGLSGWLFGAAVAAVHILAALQFSRLQTGRIVGARLVERHGVDAVARMTLAVASLVVILAMAVTAAGRG